LIILRQIKNFTPDKGVSVQNAHDYKVLSGTDSLSSNRIKVRLFYLVHVYLVLAQLELCHN